MCGRFSLGKNPEEIVNLLDPAPDEWQDAKRFLPGFNIAPTSETPVLTQAEGTLTMSCMRWGLVPSWAKELSIGSKMINARSESAHQKPSFRNLIPSQRCLVIAEGYYEWQRKGRTKTPFYLHPAEEPLLIMAGLWDHWINEEGEEYHTYTILTTTPTPDLSHIHDRMPVILSPEHRKAWLSPAATKSTIEGIMQDKSVPLTFHQVSPQVNSVRNDSPDLILPTQEEPPNQPELDLF